MDDVSRLKKYRLVWQKKKILRKIYHEWYDKIISDLSNHPKTLEIGSGIGNFKEYYKNIISSDINKYPWLDLKVDAVNIPFKKDELGNIVLIDVLHHISNPCAFLTEAFRVLKPGGRIILVEPYPSFFSLIAYKLFHPEPFIFNIDPFKDQKSISKKAWDANQAMPYLIFFKKEKEFNKLFKNKFVIKKKQLFSFLIYPLSGGFENKSFVPLWAYNFFRFLENLFIPVRSLFAFRCYVVLEKQNYLNKGRGR